MTFQEYQRIALSAASYPNQGRSLIYPALGLAGETGEVMEKVQRGLELDGSTLDENTRLSIMKDLGDVLWYLTALGNEMGITLKDIARHNIEKLGLEKQL